MSVNTTPSLVTVGDRTASEPRILADLLAGSGVALAAGCTVAGAVAAEILTPALPRARRTEYRWHAERAVGPDDTFTVESVVTRVAGNRIERYVRLLDDAGSVRESGTETWLLDSPEDAAPTPELDFCTAEWGAALRDSLESDRDFTSSLSTWDGTIGLRCGDRELHLRIYKGRIVDVTRRTPHGATFTFVAPAHTWVDLVLSDGNDFMRRAISGEFSSTGDGYEYLRLTKPLNTIITHARALARKARS
ncbi:hypothetical protein [Rhodococcus chondri]|uniref:Thioesterase n=1 Tax=Rhodococcus chondri TaxID=3065941 RepID=A0ABU7JL92_9NOCA|nr:hypothetical protein [Rhodococcus sp. CC-R104]MEE2030580.1 hypothetical protein [Rhodococcus sp. CC-R104]